MNEQQAKLQLERARNTIDEIDRVIVAALEERMSASRRVAEAKAVLGLPVYVPKREAQVLASRVAALEDETLAPYVERLFTLIMTMSREEQNKL